MKKVLLVFLICLPLTGCTTEDACDKCAADEACFEGVCHAALYKGVFHVSSSIDVVFVVDNSGSMAGEQDQLGRSFQAFANVLEQKFGDTFHVAVVTVGMESQACPPCDATITKSCINETQENGRFQDRKGHITWTAGTPVFDFVQDSTCRVVTNSNADCFYDVAQERGIALVGVNGCGYERGLAPLKAALKSLQGSYNAGFIRDDATLAVIVISDENDCGEVGDVYELTADGGNICYFAAKGEGPEPGNPDYTPMAYHPTDPEQRPYELTPVEHYYNFLVNEVKGGREGMVKFAAIVGVTDPGDPSTTTIEYQWGTRNRWEIVDACATPGCTGDYCFAEPGTRYIQLAQMFGQNGFVDTICQNDFTQTMEKLGTCVACPESYKFSAEPQDPALMVVTVNGKEIPRYTCSIQGQLELCDGPNDTSCSQGTCGETWTYCTAEDQRPVCAGLDFSRASGGLLVFADHYQPCQVVEGDLEVAAFNMQ
ncbi:hypothetical protein ACFL2F_03175 [Myxococcota bacterium]